MNWLKQNWVKVGLGIIILVSLVWVKKWEDGLAGKVLVGKINSPVATIPTSITEPKDTTCLSYQKYPLSLKFDSKIEVKHGDDGYYLYIQSLNESVCVWRYGAGTKPFTYLETTKAQGLERHLFKLDAFACSDLSVLCFTDDGKNYLGIFK